MADWVDCTATPSQFGGFAADMGAYIGPWPLLPPGETGGLNASTHDEVDFFVALPNPVHPTDPGYVADGSYDTPYWDAYRYLRPSFAPATRFDYFGDWTGPGASSPVPPTPPSGVHLYVVVYFGSPETTPPNPPEFYVPASYAAGGSAALETAMGHWSSAQAGFTQTAHVSPSGSGDAYYYQATHTDSGDNSVPAAADARIADILAATPVSGGAWPAIDADKDGSSVDTTVQVIASVAVKPYDGTAALAADTPPALGSLTYGVDYYAPPQIGPDGGADNPAYQYTAAAAWAWAAGASDGQYGEQWADQSSGVTLPVGIPTRVQWVPGSSLGGRPWTVAGNLIADIVSPSKPVPPAGLDAYALDYSTVTALTFCIVMAPKFLYDGTITGLPDLTMPGIGASSGFQDGPVITTSTPDLVIDRSTWQFWVPGAVVPTGVKWHMAGGHYAATGAVPLEIYTPTATGLQWVQFADGPA